MKYTIERELALLERRTLLGCPKRERKAVASRILTALEYATLEAFTTGRVYNRAGEKETPAEIHIKLTGNVSRAIHASIFDDRKQEHASKPRKQPTSARRGRG